MGLFDELRCAFPLPDADISADEVFQTKDLESAMEDFTITAEGHLLHSIVEYVPTGETRASGLPRMERVDKAPSGLCITATLDSTQVYIF